MNPTISAIMDKLREFQSVSGSDIVWFRGHSNKHYKLQSTLQREVNQDFAGPHHKKKFYQEVEKFSYETLFHERQKQPITQWEAVYYMQHYRIPTRLLDWTSSVDIALYFALSGKQKDTDTQVILLNPNALNKVLLDIDDVMVPSRAKRYTDLVDANENFMPTAVAIDPKDQLNPQINKRIIRQQGCFTCHKFSINDLYEEVDLKISLSKYIGKSIDLTIDQVFATIDITDQMVVDIRDFLSQKGITQEWIYPGEELHYKELVVNFIKHLKAKKTLELNEATRSLMEN